MKRRFARITSALDIRSDNADTAVAPGTALPHRQASHEVWTRPEHAAVMASDAWIARAVSASYFRMPGATSMVAFREGDAACLALCGAKLRQL